MTGQDDYNERVEKVARWMLERDWLICSVAYTWDEEHPKVRDAYRVEARAILDAAELPRLLEERDAAGEALATGEASDGYHTHQELYEYRMLYNAHAAIGWLYDGVPVVKSWRHSDGEPCFGGGWFVVVATLSSGQVSNHYRAEHWGLFNVPEVDLPPKYDGHTPADAAARLAAHLTAPLDGFQ